MTPQLILWNGLDEWRTEAAWIDLTADGVRATGTQVGADPIPYRVDYELDAPERFVTRRFEVRAGGTGWSRRVELTHDGDGGWRCVAEHEGHVDLPAPGGDAEILGEARDCDLGVSPLTNLMPVRRHALHEHAGAADFVMAWVSVPALEVFASGQRYEHVRRGKSAAVVRFVDRGRFAGFTAELELDPDGLVLVYPGLARRVVEHP
ncbi:MAG: putative glycolipid-binding domain-containing protein [Acidimicrobiia bacterium]